MGRHDLSNQYKQPLHQTRGSVTGTSAADTGGGEDYLAVVRGGKGGGLGGTETLQSAPVSFLRCHTHHRHAGHAALRLAPA